MKAGCGTVKCLKCWNVYFRDFRNTDPFSLLPLFCSLSTTQQLLQNMQNRPLPEVSHLRNPRFPKLKVKIHFPSLPGALCSRIYPSYLLVEFDLEAGDKKKHVSPKYPCRKCGNTLIRLPEATVAERASHAHISGAH